MNDYIITAHGRTRSTGSWALEIDDFIASGSDVTLAFIFSSGLASTGSISERTLGYNKRPNIPLGAGESRPLTPRALRLIQLGSEPLPANRHKSSNFE